MFVVPERPLGATVSSELRVRDLDSRSALPGSALFFHHLTHFQGRGIIPITATIKWSYYLCPGEK